MSSAFPFNSTTSFQINGSTMLSQKSTTVKISLISSIPTSGKNSMNSKKKKISSSKWKAWKSKMIWPQKSTNKSKKPTTKSNKRSTLLENNTPWKDTELPMKRTNLWINSKKFWSKRALTLHWLKKEWETEVDLNLWLRSRSQRKMMIT